MDGIPHGCRISLLTPFAFRLRFRRRLGGIRRARVRRSGSASAARSAERQRGRRRVAREARGGLSAQFRQHRRIAHAETGRQHRGQRARERYRPAAVRTGLAGVFTLDGERVRFSPAPGASVLLGGQPVTDAVDVDDDRSPASDELIAGDVRLVVHVSGDRRAIRVRDPNGPLARGFKGFSWFPIDEQYRVLGRFIEDRSPQRFKVLNTYGHVDDYTSDGVVEFELLGRTLRLRPFTTRPKRFYFVFRDASSGAETYETARFLYSDLREDGTTVLDFNMAYNPPCAFNPYTTCPIPLRENRLPVKVLAGEKAYPDKVPLPSGPPR
jgi:uncharacterized protein (DUF1684 family)